MNNEQSYSENSQAWIGVDIGGTKTAVVLSSEPPAMQGRIEFPTLPEQGPERAIALIKQHIHQIIRSSGLDKSRLGGIGVSCGGPLDQAAGIIQAPPNLATWIDVPITSILQKEFQLPCRIENDANAGAIAEHRFGAGQGTRHMVFLTMGTGLGAGVITDGRLLSGASGQPAKSVMSALLPPVPSGQQSRLGRGLGQRSGNGSGRRSGGSSRH